jgi:hypothetical protein
MILPCADGSHIFFSSSTVISLSQVFFGLTTTVSASKATGSSMYSRRSLAVLDLLGEDRPRGVRTSVSPRQNFLKPPPVPDTPTVTRWRPCFAFWNSSATASVTGKTVLEPSTLTNAVVT